MTSPTRTEQRPSALLLRCGRIAKNVGIPAFVSIVVSTLVGVAFQVRLENSKNMVDVILHQREAFDASQNNLFIELGRYTGQVLDKHTKPADLLNAASHYPVRGA